MTIIDYTSHVFYLVFINFLAYCALLKCKKGLLAVVLFHSSTEGRAKKYYEKMYKIRN